MLISFFHLVHCSSVEISIENHSRWKRNASNTHRWINKWTERCQRRSHGRSSLIPTNHFNWSSVDLSTKTTSKSSGQQFQREERSNHPRQSQWRTEHSLATLRTSQRTSQCERVWSFQSRSFFLQINQLENDLKLILCQKEELEIERDSFKVKYSKLNLELNKMLHGQDKPILDIELLLSENRWVLPSRNRMSLNLLLKIFQRENPRTNPREECRQCQRC